MKLFKKETAYLSQILVRISSVAGLLDMMRYDRCFPATEDDANKIVKLLPLATPAGKLQPGDRIVRLLRCAHSDNPPTVARWRSFNCSVIDFRSISEPTWTDEEIASWVKAGKGSLE